MIILEYDNEYQLIPIAKLPKSLCIPAVWVRLRSSSALSTSWEKQFQGSKHQDSVRFLQGPEKKRNRSCLTLGETNLNYLKLLRVSHHQVLQHIFCTQILPPMWPVMTLPFLTQEFMI